MNTTQKEEAGTSPKTALQIFRFREQALEKEIKRLRKEQESERQQFVAGMLARGWKRFDFFSSYLLGSVQAK